MNETENQTDKLKSDIMKDAGILQSNLAREALNRRLEQSEREIESPATAKAGAPRSTGSVFERFIKELDAAINMQTYLVRIGSDLDPAKMLRLAELEKAYEDSLNNFQRGL